MTNKRRVLEGAVLAMAIALGLAGCGGGSNVRPDMGGSNPPPPDNPPPPEDTGGNEGDPAIDAHLTLVHAKQAHDAGYNGQGVVIGVVDTGINAQHPDLAGRVLASKIYLDCNVNDCATDDVVGHGTTVAEVAAGKPFGDWPGGIAPDAQLVSARIIQDEEPKDDGSGHGNEVQAADADFFANYLHPYLIGEGVQVMNNSWGGLYFDPAHPAQVATAFAAAYRPFVIDHDGIVVFAAGNSGFDDPSDLASLPHWAPELEQGWLVAVALDTQQPTKLADYSNRCGRAMDYCLTAPGNVLVPGPYEGFMDDDGWNIYSWEGTSFAAPEVSGAAAVVWSAFPYFNNDLVRQTLLGTAQDLGAPGVDKTFGWGLLDVGKAVKGPGTFAWGDVEVSFDDITSTWSNDIDGTGGLIKRGTGTLVLAGRDTYLGGTTVAGGSLRAAHVLPGDVQVQAAGTLDAAPGVAGDLTSGGRVDVHGTDTVVGGDYHQQAGATLAIRLGSKLDVAGQAVLDGGTLEVTGAEDGYVADTHTTVLAAAGGVSGRFDRLLKDQGVVFTATTIGYDAGAVWLDTTGLDVTVAAAGAGVHYTAASLGAARRVQGAFENLNRQLSNGSVAGLSAGFVRAAGQFQQAPSRRQAQASLESLSGQLHGASAAMTLQAIDATGRALAERLAQGPDPAHAAQTWSRSLRLHGDMHRSGFGQVDYQLSGLLVGNDLALGPHALVGFGVSRGQGNQMLATRLDRNRSRHTALMAYAGWYPGQGYVHGRIGVGQYHQRMMRLLLLGRQYHGVWTDYTGNYRVAHLEAGWHVDRGGVRLTPFASLEHDRLTRTGFVERGAGGFGLKAGAHTVRRWQAGVGMKLGRQWHGLGPRSLRLQARVQWRRALSVQG